MPRPTGATGAMAAGAVALDGTVGFGQALGAPPLPRPFPMVGVVATGGAAVAATLGIGALRGIAPPGAGDAAQRSAEAPPKALAMPRIMPPIMPPDLLGALWRHTA
mmetsp:Transcript_71616/g.158227  ORF Transcript_71616/g.158227 Transcript_71616/m.158227 type:complete len:106 (-) Transcript_71616:2187-2504(-)